MGRICRQIEICGFGALRAGRPSFDRAQDTAYVIAHKPSTKVDDQCRQALPGAISIASPGGGKFPPGLKCTQAVGVMSLRRRRYADITGLERSDLDQWVSWVLKVSSENAQPPEQVWPRIVHQIARQSRWSYKMQGEAGAPGVVLGPNSLPRAMSARKRVRQSAQRARRRGGDV